MTIEQALSETSPESQVESTTVSQYLNQLLEARGAVGAGVYSWKLEVETSDTLANLIGARNASVIPGEKSMRLSFCFLHCDVNFPARMGSVVLSKLDFLERTAEAILEPGYETSKLIELLSKEL
jgi:hypothetical protein